MPRQTVTMRLDDDDLTFLASLEISGATNLSEKIRAILAEARAQREGRHDYSAAYDFARQLFAGPERALNEAEVKAAVRSELVHRLLAWMPETSAFLLSGSPSTDDAARERIAALRRLEQGIGERVLSLVDSVLQLARAGFPGCHDPQTLTNRSQSAVMLHRRSDEKSQGDKS